MYIVKVDFMYSKYSKVFNTLRDMWEWAQRNGYNLVQTKVAHIYTVSFEGSKES